MADSRALHNGLVNYYQALQLHLVKVEQKYREVETAWDEFRAVYNGNAAAQFQSNWAKMVGVYEEYIAQTERSRYFLDERISALSAANRPEEMLGGGAALKVPSRNKTFDHKSARMRSRFGNIGNIAEIYDTAVQKLGQSKSGSRFLEQIGGRQNLEVFINRKGDVPTQAAFYATKARLTPQERGNIVHRIAELRDMKRHPVEVLSGTRLIEQRIDFTDVDGKERYVELDQVIIRGGKYYIRDYKPVNYMDFEKTLSGKKWAEWMANNVGEDFREQVASGQVNPHQIRNMPPELKKDFREFVRATVKQARRQYNTQLNQYKDLLCLAVGITPEQLPKAHIRPYFIYE